MKLTKMFIALLMTPHFAQAFCLFDCVDQRKLSDAALESVERGKLKVIETYAGQVAVLPQSSLSTNPDLFIDEDPKGERARSKMDVCTTMYAKLLDTRNNMTVRDEKIDVNVATLVKNFTECMTDVFTLQLSNVIGAVKTLGDTKHHDGFILSSFKVTENASNFMLETYNELLTSKKSFSDTFRFDVPTDTQEIRFLRHYSMLKVLETYYLRIKSRQFVFVGTRGYAERFGSGNVPAGRFVLQNQVHIKTQIKNCEEWSNAVNADPILDENQKQILTKPYQQMIYDLSSIED